VVAVVVTVLTVLSVGVVGVDAVDCDSVVKVVGVVALSEKKITGHIFTVDKGALHINYIFIEIHQSIDKLSTFWNSTCDFLMAEHIRFAHPVLIVPLACLFSMMYKFSMVQNDFGRGIFVIPLLKNVDGNKFTRENCRGITLSPVINKLFEMVLLSRLKTI